MTVNMIEKTVVLLLATNQMDGAYLQLGNELREIEAKIQGGTLRDSFELIVKPAVRASDLAGLLLRHRPHIMHFTGHGEALAGLAIEGDAGRCQYLRADEFGKIAQIGESVRMVFLNVCHSKAHAEAISEVSDFAIGIDGEIEAEKATLFAGSFYEALAFGRSVKESFEVARNLAGSIAPVLLVRHGANAEEVFLRHSEEVEYSGSTPAKTELSNDANGSSFIEQVKLLLLATNSMDHEYNPLGDEARAIDCKIQTGPLRDSFELIAKPVVSVSDLGTFLLRVRPDIVHFSGHPENQKPNQDGIILEDEQGHIAPIRAGELAGVLSVFKDNIRVAFFNTCHSRLTAERVAHVIDYVIAMDGEIDIESARAFASVFYQALSFGRSVFEAFDAAKYLANSEAPLLLVRAGVDSSEGFCKRDHAP